MLHRSRQRLLTSLGAGAEERCGGGSELAETEREMELTAGPESVRVSVPELPYLLVPELDRVSCLNLGSGTSVRLRQLWPLTQLPRPGPGIIIISGNEQMGARIYSTRREICKTKDAIKISPDGGLT